MSIPEIPASLERVYLTSATSPSLISNIGQMHLIPRKLTIFINPVLVDRELKVLPLVIKLVGGFKELML